MKIYLRQLLILLVAVLLLLGIYLSISYKKQAPERYIFITQQQAINIIKDLPEVENYLDEKNTFIRAEERGTDYWVVQVGSINKSTEDTPPHTATFNWYKIDKTGKIVCSMFIYDKKGKFLGSGETKSVCIQTQNLESQAVETVKKEGYEVFNTKTFNPNSDFSVLIGSELGSADGYTQKAFFFNKNNYLGTDSKTPSITIFYAWEKDNIIALKYILYNKDDSLCCATAGYSIVRFKWDGVTFKPLDKIPTDNINSDKHR